MSDISNRKPDAPEIYVQNSVVQQQNNSTENNSDCFQHNDTLPVRRVLPFGTPTRHWAVLVVLVVVVLAVVGAVYLVDVTTNPGHGPEAVRVRHIADAAAKHLSSDPSVVSAKVVEASADPGGTVVRVDARLKDETSPEQAAQLLASTHDAAFGNGKEERDMIAGVHLSWTVNNSSIDSYFDLGAASSDLKARTVKDLAPVGEAVTLLRPEEPSDLRVDYGSVTTVPDTLTSPSGSRSTRSLSMRGWLVETYSDDDGQFATPPFQEIVIAVRQVRATGTIKTSGKTLSITGLVTDTDQSLTIDAAAPVVHAVADCNAAGLTTLTINNTPDKNTSNDSDSITFTCQDGTWTPQHHGTRGQDEAAILQRATEL